MPLNNIGACYKEMFAPDSSSVGVVKHGLDVANTRSLVLGEFLHSTFWGKFPPFLYCKCPPHYVSWKSFSACTGLHLTLTILAICH